MTQYTTGEIAKLCGVTVRTVQFYDSKNLLNPSDLTDGGRRLYSDEDVEKLRVICFLKDLGFSLKDISALLNEPDSQTALQFLLESRRRELEERIAADKEALAGTRELQKNLGHFKTLTPKTFGVIADIVDSKKKLVGMRIRMLLVGLVMDAAWIATLVYGIASGTWWLFAIGLAVVIALGVLVTRYYIAHTAYVCPEDHTVFRPPLRDQFFTAQTPSMRKLKCPSCGYKGYCLEIYVPDSKPRREGKYLVWDKDNR